MDSPFLQEVATSLAGPAIRVIRFEFPYMRARRTSGTGGAPDREPVLRQAWLETIDAFRDPGGPSPSRAAHRLVIGGKSLGGRIASLVADSAHVDGLVCLGYPFHPPASPAKLRTAHLAELATRTLIVQGTRDPFGGRDDVAGYSLSSRIRVCWLESGDHSWKPLARSGRTLEQNMAQAIAGIRQVLESLRLD